MNERLFSNSAAFVNPETRRGLIAADEEGAKKQGEEQLAAFRPGEKLLGSCLGYICCFRPGGKEGRLETGFLHQGNGRKNNKNCLLRCLRSLGVKKKSPTLSFVRYFRGLMWKPRLKGWKVIFASYIGSSWYPNIYG
jgi:hypothetical protein